MSRQRYNNNWPFRQGDNRWKKDVMWDRDAVIAVHRFFNGRPINEAEKLLYDFTKKGGNSIGNEGCLLTCLAMVLSYLLGDKSLTPKSLNDYAKDYQYYTPAGLSMVALYADLVCDFSDGEIQLCLKEEYLSGEKGWKPVFPSESLPVLAYRSLPNKVRKNYLMMLKIGTYDDTFASHYVLADPDNPGTPDENDLAILDPIMPRDHSQRIWRLSNSADQMKKEEEILEEWERIGIQDLQIAGVWIFGRWKAASQKSLIGPLLKYLNQHVI